jgi:hypothetical protein
MQWYHRVVSTKGWLVVFLPLRGFSHAARLRSPADRSPPCMPRRSNPVPRPPRWSKEQPWLALQHSRQRDIMLPRPVHLPLMPQEELVKEQPVVYNKEDMLNPYFVVFGHRRAAAASN